MLRCLGEQAELELMLLFIRLIGQLYWALLQEKKKIPNSFLQNSMPYCSHFSEVTVYNIALLSPLRNNIIYWSSSFIVYVISIFWDRDTFCMMYTLLTSNSSCLLYVQGFIIRNIYASWYPVVLCLLFSALHRKLNFFSFWLTPTWKAKDLRILPNGFMITRQIASNKQWYLILQPRHSLLFSTFFLLSLGLINYKWET